MYVELEDRDCIVYRYTLSEISELGGFKAISKHLTRSNPEDSSNGYNYVCLECSKIEMSIKRQEFSCYITIKKPWVGLCGHCTALLLLTGMIQL